MDLSSALEQIPPEHREALSKATYADFHHVLVAAAKTGEFDIIQFWDTLSWLRGDWRPWRAFVKAVFGLPMDATELALYQKCTGRQEAPTEQAREAWMPTGRRARKTATAAVIASYVAAYWDHSTYTAPGQRAVIPVLAKNKQDAQTIKQYVDAIFMGGPLACLVEKSDTEVVRLSTGCDIQIKAATIMAGRSPAIPLAILDEVAFFRTDDAANPDTEILRGIRPAMATVPKPLLLALSSPYARRGELWKNYKAHYGKERSKVLVWKADTLTMHPGNAEVAAHVAEQYQLDPVSADAEYGGNFRKDVEAFVPEEVVDACTTFGTVEREPVPGVQYVAFVDPSGGTSDSFTLSIAHWERAKKDAPDKAVQDLLKEIPAPFEPSEAVAAICEDLKRFNIKTVEGDHYAGEWPREAFRKHGIAYQTSDYAKREIYKNVLPILTSGRAELVDSPRLRAQLIGLDRKTTAAGQELIDHPPGEHDDVSNSCAGALFKADRMRLAYRNPPPPPPKTIWDVLKQDVQKQLEKEKKGSQSVSKRANPWLRSKR